MNKKLPPEITEAFKKITDGDLTYRLSESAGELGKEFNSIAENLSNMVDSKIANESSLNNYIEDISKILMNVAAGDFQTRMERSFTGDTIDTFAFMLNSTIEEMQFVIEERNRQSEEMQHQLEVKVAGRTLELEQAMIELKNAQSELILSEKLAALGQLVSGVAHEINTPLGAIKASISTILSILETTLPNFADFISNLNQNDRKLFFELIDTSINRKTGLSTREARSLRKELTINLKEKNIVDADKKARLLAQMTIFSKDIDTIIPILTDNKSLDALQFAYKITELFRSSRNIYTATEKSAKVVFALKSYSHFDQSGKLREINLENDIETVLVLYSNQLKQGIEVVREFNSVGSLTCYPDLLSQVWTNLIHNAIQAMKNKGILYITAKKGENKIVITFKDNGEGISDENREKIFNPFFTTRERGEGTGLGLDIVRKIIEKHKGRIDVDSELGVGSSFMVTIPTTLTEPT
ncbi:MAG: ATP-binding protein [Leptospirales bacterium]